MSPLVSVLLPTYNPGPELQKALASIINQTYSDLEVLLIDDGSEAAIAHETFDPRIRIIRQSHHGVAAALNNGIKAASGKYLARMDTDDVSEVTRFAKQIDYMEAHPEVDLVATQVHCPPSLSPGLLHYMSWQNQLLSHKEIFVNRFADAPVIHPTVMIRASSMRTYGYYQTGIGPEDFELWLRWLQSGAIFAKIPEPLYYWNDHPQRLTRTDPNLHRDHFYKLKAKYLANWLKQQHRDYPAWICGKSKTVFQRTAHLETYGISIAGYVDVQSPSENSPRKIISYDELSPDTHPLVLSYVSDREGKLAIRAFLLKKGFTEGESFFIMA